MRGNPAWNEVCNSRRHGEMLGTKNGYGDRKKQSAKRRNLVYAAFPRHFLENLDEADDEKQRRTNINPECRRRNAKRRRSQSKHGGNQRLETAQEDLQRWALPCETSSGKILKPPINGSNRTVTGVQDSRSKCRLPAVSGAMKQSLDRSGCKNRRTGGWLECKGRITVGVLMEFQRALSAIEKVGSLVGVKPQT